MIQDEDESNLTELVSGRAGAQTRLPIPSTEQNDFPEEIKIETDRVSN